VQQRWSKQRTACEPSAFIELLDAAQRAHLSDTRLPFACGGSENVERIVGAITLFTEDKAKDTLNSLAIAAT
jgi:hypothetical protein